jgi:aldose 1-epimerase
MIQLKAGNCTVELVPECGGGVAAFRWRGVDVMRPAVPGQGVLGLSSFPLIPFSNRIAQGRFRADGRAVTLPPNLPGADQPHAIHGFGWQSVWDVAGATASSARLVHRHAGGDWPWPYTAEQHFRVGPSQLEQTLSLRNDGDSVMPAGLGVHPYFPRADARLNLTVDGRWDTDATCLPTQWCALERQPDWFGGDAIDHVFTGRQGSIRIDWPTHMLTIDAADDLRFMVVYVPPGADYFCVEPVSHMTDAVNRAEDTATTGLRWLAPGETWTTRLGFTVAPA